MSLLDDLTSADPTRIWSAACAVRRLREPTALQALAQHVDDIRQATRGVDLGGALRSNATHLAFALTKLDWVRRADACLCGLYPMDDQYDPRQEAADGHVRILGTALIEEKWVDFHTCQCTGCGATFRVEEREYHYPWWAWKHA